MSKTTHEDLINMGGYWSYDIQNNYKNKYEDNPKLTVGVNEYEILNYHDDSKDPTGLNAATVRNKDTGEVTIMFVGTQGGTDIWQDAQLVSDITPSQFEAANAYYNDMKELYDISYLAGNSLGGGLAGYVGSLHADVTAVTINPAPLPNKLKNKNNVNNVYNYIVENDPLHLATVAGGMEARIIGKRIMLKAGRYANQLVKNHVGDYKVSNGNMEYSTASFVPFSIWHDNEVISAGKYGKKIQIDTGNMTTLVAALNNQKATMDSILKDNFTTAKTELTEFKSKKEQRAQDTKDAISNAISSSFSSVESEVGTIESSSTSNQNTINSQLSSSDSLVQGFIQGVADAVDSGFNTITKQVNQLTLIDLSGLVASVGQNVLSSMDISDKIADGMLKQHSMIEKGINTTLNRWTYISDSAAAISKVISEADETIASGIASNKCPKNAISVPQLSWPAGNVTKSEGEFSKNIAQKVEEMKKSGATMLVSNILENIVSLITTPISLALKTMSFALETIEIAFAGVNGLTGFGLDVLDAVDVLDLTNKAFKKAKQQINNAYNTFKSFSNSVQASIKVITTGLDNLPELIEAFEPYIKDQLFSETTLESVCLKYVLTQNMLERNSLSFGEVAYQLSNHKAEAIDALGDRAKSVQKDLDTVSDSISNLVG